MSNSESFSAGSSSSSNKSKDLGDKSRMIMLARLRSNRMKEHKCELISNTEEINKLYPLSFWRRCEQRWIKATLVSGSNRRSKKYLRSSAAVCLEEERQLVSPYCIIHPCSEFRVIWLYFMSAVLLIYIVCMPFVLAFQTPFKPPHMWALNLLYVVLSTLLMVNIGVTFYTGILQPDTREVILDRWIISRAYLRGRFGYEVATAIPWGVVLFFMSFNSSRYVFYIYLHILFWISLLNVFRASQLVLYLEELSEVTGISEADFRLASLLLRYLVFIHWSACAQFLVPHLVHGDNLKNIPNSWVVTYGLLEPGNLADKYINSYSRAISVFMRLGYGLHVQEQTLEDAVVTCAILVIGFFFSAVVFGVLLHYLASQNTSLLKYHSNTMQLRNYMRFKRLPPATQQRMSMYYDNKFQKGYFKESEILETLSDSLREEINMHCCHRLVTEVDLFRELSSVAVSAIVGKLVHEICLPTDVMVKAGTIGDCMYFLQSGTAAVFTMTGKEICHLQDGNYFGEIALIEKNSRRAASVIAVDICEIYRLDRADFVECTTLQPGLLERLEMIASWRKDKIHGAEEAYARKLKDSFAK